MIKLPDLKNAFGYENDFFLSCDNSRIGRILARYELYKMIKHLPGSILECGIFKGPSFVQLATFRDFFGETSTRKLVGFDTFTEFPEARNKLDKPAVSKFIQAAGGGVISTEQHQEVLDRKGLNKNIELVAGNILETVPKYASDHQELKISLLFLDTDTYESAEVILKHLYPHLIRGGILVLDDYGRVAGETKAVDEFISKYFKNKKVELHRSPFCYASSYLVKED